ncbi:MAG: glycosyltransferase [Salinibacterium sp.]|nr:glycosyltransferase [Salinibacterium sp.]MBF0673462.1 glycosyltransferase [Salinibacterium sp.]
MLEHTEPIHVVHVSSVHPWTDNRIHYRECVSLAGLGYRVSLVAVESRITGGPSPVDVTVLPRRPRLQRMLLGSIAAVRAAIRTGASVFHLHDPELVWAIPVLRAMGKRVIYDAHEDLPEQVVSKEYVHPLARPLMRATAHLVVRVARLSNHVVTATETIAKRFPSGRVSVVHNYPPLREEEGSAGSVASRPLSVAYIGGISEIRGAEQMIDALGNEAFPVGWRLELAGPMGESLAERLQRSPGWERTDYLGHVTPDEARDLLLRARVGLVLFRDTQAHRDALPTKMFEYFAAGIPVIASDFPLWRSIIDRLECGLLVDESSPSSIAAAIAKYAHDPELLERHAANARRAAVEVLNWSQEVPVLAAAYESARKE